MAHIKNTFPGLPVVRYHAVRRLFDKLTERLDARPSSLRDPQIEENLAIAFLVVQERLVWADLANSRPPSYLGHKITKCQTDGYFVAAILVKNPYELVCILSLPCIVMNLWKPVHGSCVFVVITGCCKVIDSVYLVQHCCGTVYSNIRQLTH